MIAVPSGNFGNICAGILAMQSGLPVQHFIAACNVNDIVSDYLSSEILRPKEAVPTLSNAMDVGNPSNFMRILSLYNNSLEKIQKDIKGFSGKKYKAGTINPCYAGTHDAATETEYIYGPGLPKPEGIFMEQILMQRWPLTGRN